MSYSFTVTASTKEDVKHGVADAFDAVLHSQPVHAADRDAAQAAAGAFVDVLAEPRADQQIAVSVSGSVGWRAEGEFFVAGVSISANLVAKAAG